MTTRYDLARVVSRLKPGEVITISGEALRDVATIHHNGYDWTPAESIMENIIGSAYEFSFQENPANGDVTFRRLKKPLTQGRTYVSPDRRQLAIVQTKWK